MKLNKNIICVVFPIMTLGPFAFAQLDNDNSKINERDRSATSVSSDQQKMNKTDTYITAQIRKEIMKADNFSTYAQNVKIITVDGKVTLKGPIRTAREHNQILSFARSVAGASNVNDEMNIAVK